MTPPEGLASEPADPPAVALPEAPPPIPTSARLRTLTAGRSLFIVARRSVDPAGRRLDKVESIVRRWALLAAVQSSPAQ